MPRRKSESNAGAPPRALCVETGPDGVPLAEDWFCPHCSELLERPTVARTKIYCKCDGLVELRLLQPFVADTSGALWDAEPAATSHTEPAAAPTTAPPPAETVAPSAIEARLTGLAAELSKLSAATASQEQRVASETAEILRSLSRIEQTHGALTAGHGPLATMTGALDALKGELRAQRPAPGNAVADDLTELREDVADARSTVLAAISRNASPEGAFDLVGAAIEVLMQVDVELFRLRHRADAAAFGEVLDAQRSTLQAQLGAFGVQPIVVAPGVPPDSTLHLVEPTRTNDPQRAPGTVSTLVAPGWTRFGKPLREARVQVNA